MGRIFEICFHCTTLLIGLTQLMGMKGLVEANAGVQFLVMFPEAKQGDKSVESEVWVTLDVANGVLEDTKVCLYTQDPETEIEADIGVSNPTTRFKISDDNNFPYGTARGQKYLMRLSATNEVVVTVRNGDHSNIDTYLALPVPDLGRRHFALTLNLKENANNFIAIATGENSAQITIRLPGVYNDKTVQFNFNNVAYENNDVITIDLDPFEAMQLQFPYDVTGSLIESSDVISVLSGSNRTLGAGLGVTKSHAVEQIPPTEFSGKLFAAFPTCIVDNENVFQYRIVSLHPSTTVEITKQADTLQEEWSSSSSTSSGSVIKSYFLHRSGQILKLDIDGLGSSVMYIQASKAVSVYYISDSETDGSRGDVFSLWVPPLDADMKSAYTFSLYDMASTTSTISIIIQKDSLDGLQISGAPLSEASETTFTTLDVSGRPDLVAGCLQSSAEYDKDAFNLKHATGVPFAATLMTKSGNEGRGNPLGYGLAESSTEEQGDEEEYCVGVDAAGFVLDPSECPSSLSSQTTTCCVVEYQKKSCQVKSSTTSCSVTSSKKLASEQTILNVSSLLACQFACLTTDGCFGANFDVSAAAGVDKDQASSIRCQLLSGYPMGHELSPSDSLRQIDCVRHMEFFIS